MFLHIALLVTLAQNDPLVRAPAVEGASARETAVAREASATVARPERWTLGQILDALRMVETGGEKHGGRLSVGDGGGAIGPFQIHRAYWKDTRLRGRWEDCRDPRYAREVVLAYWKRYCPKALESLDAETLARVHNGGPDGAREPETVKFWKKVERELVRQHEARERKRLRATAPKPGTSAPKRDVKEPEKRRVGWV